jgi:hypothetical protein
MNTTRYNLRLAFWLAGVCALAACLGACASGHEREAYFESRETLVAAKPGSGSARVAMWPAGAWGHSTFAVADRRTASDTLPPVQSPASDSTR